MTETKVCTKCKELKLPTDFYTSKITKDGLGSQCKKCIYLYDRENIESKRIQNKKWRDNNREYIKQKQKEWRESNKEYRKNAHLQRLYGISLELYNRMVEEQKGLCAICKKLPITRGLCVDHCHETGNIRGLLCESCNSGVGMFKDEPEFLFSAYEYLTKYKENK